MILELCKQDPHSVPPAIASGVNALYGFIPAMDLACVRQLSQFLSFHLLSFKLAWPYWQHLANDFRGGSGEGESAGGADGAEEEDEDNSKYFISLLIDTSARSDYVYWFHCVFKTFITISLYLSF